MVVQPVTVTPVPTITPAPTAMVVQPVTVTPVPTIQIVSIPTVGTSAIPSPIPILVADGTTHPSLRHLEEKGYMLDLINAQRAEVGVEPLVLGDNVAAQLHAELLRANCISSHWGIDGLIPVMRYSLAGGYQSNSENVNGIDYCYTAADNARKISSIKQEVEDAMDDLMGSSGHRNTILTPEYRKVNIGLVWDSYILWVVQQFEGDYVQYDVLPVFTEGVLELKGTVRNGVEFLGDGDLTVGIFYDRPPRPLTRGQIARTYCSRVGRAVTFLRRPVAEGQRYTQDVFTRTYAPCPNPHDVPADTPGPRSPGEASDLWRAAYEASKLLPKITFTAPWVTATEWTANGTDFSVRADLSRVLADSGPGVYTVIVWGWLPATSEKIVISEYSIFHEMTPPGSYGAWAREVD